MARVRPDHPPGHLVNDFAEALPGHPRREMPGRQLDGSQTVAAASGAVCRAQPMPLMLSVPGSQVAEDCEQNYETLRR